MKPLYLVAVIEIDCRFGGGRIRDCLEKVCLVIFGGGGGGCEI